MTVPAIEARRASLSAVEAERDALLKERDDLRQRLVDADWERDTAESEAAVLRDDLWPARDEGARLVSGLGRVYLLGDLPPVRPEGHNRNTMGPWAALVSLPTGQIYVPSNYADELWCKYGLSSVVSDWETLHEHGPLVAVSKFAYRDHAAVVQAQRDLHSTIHELRSFTRVGWPADTARVEALVHRFGQYGADKPTVAEWINALYYLASATRIAWQDEVHKVPS